MVLRILVILGTWKDNEMTWMCFGTGRFAKSAMGGGRGEGSLLGGAMLVDDQNF